MTHINFERTGYRPIVLDPAPEPASEQGGPADLVKEVDLVESTELSEPAVFAGWEVEPSDGVAGPLAAALVGGLALVLAILAPVTGVKIAGLVIVTVAIGIVIRLMRRGGKAQ